MKKLAIYLILSLLVFVGCKKNKTEPEETQPTKESLLCREWELEKEFVNGEEAQTVSEQYWDIKKDGTFKMTSFYGSVEVIKNWEWRWADDKESLEINSLDTLQIKDYLNSGIGRNAYWIKLDIKRITEKELVMERQIDDDLYCVELN